MKNILITGGLGFIGSNLANFLKNKSYKIFVIDNLSSNKVQKLEKGITIIKKNIIDIKSIKNFKNKIDCIIHLAASAEILITPEKEKKYFDDNIVGLQEVMNFSLKNKIKKFIFASSSSIYEETVGKRTSEISKLNPKHYYAYTKYLGEKMVSNYFKINKLNYTILRFFNIFGPKSDAVVGKFLAQKLQKKKLTIFGNGRQKRDFLYIDDLNRAILKILRKKQLNKKIYNLGFGNSSSILSLAKLISKNKFEFLPKRNDDIEVSISNIDKIKKDLNWSPKIDLKKGLQIIKFLDEKRLKKVKLKSLKYQKKIIKQFNKKK